LRLYEKGVASFGQTWRTAEFSKRGFLELLAREGISLHYGEEILLGLLEPTSGKALVLGGRLSENRKPRSRVGVILEGDSLSSQLTAYENLEFYARAYGLKNTV